MNFVQVRSLMTKDLAKACLHVMKARKATVIDLQHTTGEAKMKIKYEYLGRIWTFMFDDTGKVFRGRVEE